ncbi:MAG: response regulator [Deltaproteobacteria bacterium]|nr:response regulator [Deltaproteobacteria bacterium]
MRKSGLFLQFMLVFAAVGSLLAATAAYIISVPLIRTLTEAEERPLHLVSDEIFNIASNSFHDLLDERKEDDAEEVEAAQQDVLARIVRYKPSVRSADYHFVVVDRDNRIIADSGKLFGEHASPDPGAEQVEGQIRIPDRNGRRLIGYQRTFPAWGWRLIALTPEEALRKETRRIKLWVYGAGLVGFLVLVALFYAVLRSRIEVPLRTLVRYAHGLKEGDYKTVPEMGEGEIGELAEAFNRMTHAIRQRERKLAELAKFPESNPNLLMKVAPDGEVLYANPSVTRKLAEMGLPAGHAELILPHDIQEIVREMRLIEGRQKEFLWKTRDRTIEYTVFGFADEDAVVFHGIDVTEKKRMEEQLFHAHKMETLGRIAGGVAHDFNNLLAGILGYASLLQSGPIADPKVAEAIVSIEKAAERGTQLTRQLLGFARKGTHEFLPVNLNRILDETADIVAQTIEKTISIRRDKAEDLPTVLGESNQLHQCLMNLCINARDAMTQGGMLTIATRRALLSEDRQGKFFRIPAGLYAAVAIRDEGHGMDEATQERIFDPFFTTKEKEKGTGLGMSMVYGIVKNHGGYVTVKSTPGKGTDVEILIPAAKEGGTAMAAETRPVTEAPFDHAGTALLVDDEEFVRDVASAMLSTLGYEVLTASNGMEGVEIFRREKERISLTILDLMMPVMDGRKAFEEIRAIDPAARIVISTGFSGDEDVDRLKAMGASAILPKPYTFGAMTRTLGLVATWPPPGSRDA